MSAVAAIKRADRVQMLTCADPVAPHRRRRVWLEIGCALSVGQLLILLIRDDRELWLDLYLTDGRPQCAVPLQPMRPGCMAPHHLVIPRAVRLDHLDRPAACLIEVQYHGTGLPCWRRNPLAMEGHHAKPNHAPEGV
jgi:hypothetical protein